jgi:hypothetical protein
MAKGKVRSLTLKAQIVCGTLGCAFIAYYGIIAARQSSTSRPIRGLLHPPEYFSYSGYIPVYGQTKYVRMDIVIQTNNQ